MTISPNSVKATDLTEGQNVSVLICVATAHCAIATTHVFGHIDRATDKAVCIARDGHRLWLPRRALVKGRIYEGTTTRSFDLAKWFTPDGRTSNTMARMAQHGTLAA